MCLRLSQHQADPYLEGEYGKNTGITKPLPSCLNINGVVEYVVQRATSLKIIFGTDMPWYHQFMTRQTTKEATK